MATPILNRQPNNTGTGDPNGDMNSKILSWFSDKWDDLKGAYYVYHMIGWDSLLHYAGSHWRKWDQSVKAWVEALPDDEWTPQPNINYFAPAIDSVNSIMQLPEIEAVPTQEDDMQSHEVAAVAKKLWDHFAKVNGIGKQASQQYKNISNKVDLASSIFVLLGTLLIRVRRDVKGQIDVPIQEPTSTYDVQCQGEGCGYNAQIPMSPDTPAPQVCPQCQQPVSVGRGMQILPKMDPMTGQPMTTPKYKVVPKIDIESPMNFLPRAGGYSQENLRYYFLADRHSLDEIKEKWGFKASPDQIFLDGMTANYESALNFFYTGFNTQTLATKDSAMVVEGWIEPGKVEEIPEGCYFAWCNDQIIKVEKYEARTAPGEPELVKADYLTIPRVFFGRSVAFDLANLQKELCDWEALIKLHGMTSAAEPIVADENTKVSEITGRGDKVVWWRSIGPGGKEPHRMRHEQLSPAVFAQVAALKVEIQNVSGAVNAFKGEETGGVTAASAISQLRGQAELMFSKPHGSWNGAWCETARRTVKICQQDMEPWEIAQIVGKGQDLTIQTFKCVDLDTIIEWSSASAGLPRTRDEKRQELIMMFDRSALDLSDANVKQRIAELFGETGMGQTFNKDATRARMENDVMKQGGPPTFMPEIEDLQTHYSIHSDMVKSLEFDKLPENVKTIIMTHTLQTKQAIVAMAAAAAMVPQPPKDSAAGGQGGPGSPSAERGPQPQTKGKPSGGLEKRSGQHGKVGQSHPAQPSPAVAPGSTVPTGPGGPGSPQLPAPPTLP